MAGNDILYKLTAKVSTCVQRPYIPPSISMEHLVTSSDPSGGEFALSMSE